LLAQGSEEGAESGQQHETRLELLCRLADLQVGACRPHPRKGCIKNLVDASSKVCVAAGWRSLALTSSPCGSWCLPCS
jgi:hypothetical protein